MRRLGVHPRVPEHRNREFRHGKRKGKPVHSRAQVSGVSLRNTGDQVGGPSQSQRDRESADDRNYVPLELERREGLVDRSFVDIPPRDEDVPAARIAGGRDLALAQRRPFRPTPMKRSRTNAWVRISGPSPSRRLPSPDQLSHREAGALPRSCLGRKRRRTPGASSPMRATRSGPKFSTKPSLIRSVKVRTSSRD